ncbi:MAG TPA: hypothetical protein VFJ61_07745 [Solirubrobacterales bacterium]|nr:hypothetical protein [Solirubrobacterales bacterium]
MELLTMSDRTYRWNDDRLDELSRRTDRGFEELREEMRHLNARFDRLYYLVLVTIVGCFGSLVANGAFG